MPHEIRFPVRNNNKQIIWRYYLVFIIYKKVLGTFRPFRSHNNLDAFLCDEWSHVETVRDLSSEDQDQELTRQT